MNIENNYELYDRIIAATYTNIFIESNNKPYIILDSYNTNYIDKVFFEVAKSVSAFTNKKIMVKTNFFNYLLLKLGKSRKQICWYKKEEGTPIPVQDIGNFESKEFYVEPSIFKEIYQAYYSKEGIYYGKNVH